MLFSISDLRGASWPLAWAPSRENARIIAVALGIPAADILIEEVSVGDVAGALGTTRVGTLVAPVAPSNAVRVAA